ncbi:hypothetical protein [Novosphingobium sp. BW1]|uniref:hypothetical protein n=1 Tax=Novosphingobium sp. BW1 TaxID=2592621 RepID=UPI0011DE6B99|nr:hypothetical protein [Novosphingobium sp. BW1]TYC86825.1 hypothetical protein FMM79_13170 [Novosphingobium sp. BW1]
MAIALSLMVLACIALVLGGIALWRRPGHRKRAVLMLVLAGIMAVNVAILTVPTPDGRSLTSIAETQDGAPQ